MFFKKEKKVEEPIKTPVTYEIVRIKYPPHLMATIDSYLYVREKSRSGYFNPSPGGGVETVNEVSLTGLLTEILHSLEQLGIEVVQTKAKPANVVFKKAEKTVAQQP